VSGSILLMACLISLGSSRGFKGLRSLEFLVHQVLLVVGDLSSYLLLYLKIILRNRDLSFVEFEMLVLLFQYYVMLYVDLKLMLF